MSIYADRDEAFAASYRDFVGHAFDQFEFFGVDPLGVPRRHAFDRGYFAPTLIRPDPRSGGPASAGERADRALARVHRAVVRGVAGSGKTTLLRWLGWQTAKAQPADEPAPIPFMIELGRHIGSKFPKPEDLVADRLRSRMPSDWVSNMIDASRIVLLLDGLDEVPAHEWPTVQDWLQQNLFLSKNTRCFVSTRPSVVAEQWWVDMGFERFDLLQMSGYSIERFVRGWHRVAREDYSADRPSGREARQWLAESEDNLLKMLAKRPALGGMSSNPLTTPTGCCSTWRTSAGCSANCRIVRWSSCIAHFAITSLPKRWSTKRTST